jgi:competence protein ComFC
MSSVDWLRSAYDYEGHAGAAVRLLKFNRCLELAEPMSAVIGSCPSPTPPADFVVPVPIHWSRRAMRGFNQAEELAMDLPFGILRTDLLVRHRATPPQARRRGAERKRSLNSAFSAKPCKGQRILLIDDVVTSGGTLEACARELKSAGASWVGAITFARQLRD